MIPQASRCMTRSQKHHGGFENERTRQVFFEMRWRGRIGVRCAVSGDRKPPRWARLAESHQDARPLVGFHRNARESQGPQPHAPQEIAGRTLKMHRGDPQRTAMIAHLGHFPPSMHISINSCRRHAHASAGDGARTRSGAARRLRGPAHHAYPLAAGTLDAVPRRCPLTWRNRSSYLR